MPNPANTIKLFQENTRMSWVLLNIQAKVELRFSRNSNFIFSAGLSNKAKTLGVWVVRIRDIKIRNILDVFSKTFSVDKAQLLVPQNIYKLFNIFRL